eukprot:scaffold194572_cov46-Tisochrysis_lutea.AAC.1
MHHPAVGGQQDRLRGARGDTGGGAGIRAAAGEFGARSVQATAMVYIETSAKSRMGIIQSFDEIVMKILDTPELLAEAGGRATALPQTIEPDDSGACGMC